MKLFKLLLVFGLFASYTCQAQSELNDQQKEAVKNEVRQFMKNLDAAASAANEQAYANMFVQTDELAVASQGKIFDSFETVRDTVHAHLSVMEKQIIKTIDEKIYVIDKEHAVITTSKDTKATLKNGAEFEMPYVLTMLLVKKNGQWKIVHYHN